MHWAAHGERNLLSASTFSSQLLLNFSCWEKIIFLTRQRQSRYRGKREENRREEESGFQKACHKWEKLNTDSLLGAFHMAKGRWRKRSSSFSLTQAPSCGRGHCKRVGVYQLLIGTVSADGYLKRESGIGIQGKRPEICALQGNTEHPGMKTGTRVSTWIRLEVCTVQGPMN